MIRREIFCWAWIFLRRVAEDSAYHAGATKALAADSDPIAMENLAASSTPAFLIAKKSKRTHPKISVMVREAIKTKDKYKGASLAAIKKYITAKYLVDTKKICRFIKRHLSNAVKSGDIIQMNGRGANGLFKIPSRKKIGVKKKPPKSSNKAEGKNFNSFQNHEMTAEIITGRRIIDMQHFFEEIQNLSEPTYHSCGLLNVNIISETNVGLVSRFTLLCDTCKTKFFIDSESRTNSPCINQCAIAGVMSIGGNYSKLQKITSILDIPTMSGALYDSYSSQISKKYEPLCFLSENKTARNQIKENVADVQAISLVNVTSASAVNIETPSSINDQCAVSKEELDMDTKVNMELEGLTVTAIKTECEVSERECITDMNKEHLLEYLAATEIKTEIEEELSAVIKKEKIDIEESIFPNNV